ncbi:hypothetical protein [Tumebacillus permanentifrigoris]|uniref:Uncharacterized protein n=1 Tax=Tumebacillus permanentifrigoris TaxID=378543 RepID=A0A316DGJ8_9BACL|nr:hypothetical protein [Tumebacillus permanentifrigoris]PWK15693.1 hypothetical protein C7459_103234 [Tumebacillus permanentifrigoris]
MKDILEHDEADQITEAERQALLGIMSPLPSRPDRMEPEIRMLSRVERHQRRRKSLWQKFLGWSSSIR